VRRSAHLAAAMLVTGMAAAAQASPWSERQTPTLGPAQVIGSAAAGCLAGAAALPLDGPGYQAIRISRRRYFAHPDTIAFIRRLGEHAAAAGLPPFYVGDLSQPRGGPLPFGHASHQSGIDADIWFNLEPKPPLPPAARENPELPSMVLANHGAVDPARFGERHVRLLRLAASDPRVDRVFVHWTIKRALCEGFGGAGAGNRDWLRRVRPWYGHDDHFHVRLTCPKGPPGCVPQPPAPAGDGCDASLDWWSQHASPPSPSAMARPPAPSRPILPAQCRQVLAAP
jgi:penicillin-insensitive murein endopeptidase